MPFTPDPSDQAQSGFVPDPTPPPAPTRPIPASDAPTAFKSGVIGQMLSTQPSFVFDNHDEYDKQLRDISPNYDDGKLDDSLANDVRAGLEGSVIGLYKRGKLPDEVRDPSLFDRFITGLAQTVADAPVMLAGGVAGGAAGGAAGSEVPIAGNITGAGIGASAGAFALPAAMRQVLIDGIQKGDVKSFSDVLRRSGDAVWAATKGAVTGAVTEFAGGLSVGKLAGPAAATVKGLYQATALTTTADLLEGKLPTAGDFAGNAALLVPLGIIAHGLPVRQSEASQGLMDEYARSGKTPEDSEAILRAQPPTKPDLPSGLRPAIEIQHGFGEGFIEGDAEESHADAAERVLGKRPISMDQLERDPTKADQVLETPQIHEQDVIDRAFQIKRDDPEADPEEMPDRASLKSGRGFVTPDGEFLSRSEAKRWMKENEPATHEMWDKVVEGDKQAELHTEDYAEARSRAQGRDLAAGDPIISGLTPDNAARLAAARSDLNEIKAGLTSTKYGNSVLRTLFAGQRDARIAATTQLRDELAKLIPDFHDQEALSILRDYKHDPDALTAKLTEIRAGNSERLKALIPSIERAQNPSPELLEADSKLTDYYKSALEEGRQLGFLQSKIDPANYSPHILTRILDGEEPQSTGRGGPLSRRTPFANERKYPTILDALSTDRLDAQTVNALDALSVYGDRHATVMATQLLTRELANTGLGKFGTMSDRPAGWQQIGNQNFYAPREVADALRPLFEQGLRDTAFAPLLKSQSYVKALELGLSLFHVKALNITAFNNLGLTEFMRAIRTDTESATFAEAERGWAADGLTTAKTSTPYEAYKGLKASSIPTGFDKLAEAPVIKQLDSAFKGITEYTFDVVQRKFKVADASLKDAAWQAKHPEATDAERFAARRSIAKEVNSAYGGLNWDVLGKGKTFQDVSRLFLLAPDWTFSNVATAKYAFEGSPAGAAARAFWAKSFATGFAMTAAMSIAVGGRYDPTDIRHLDQVYLGKDEKGKEMYADWFFAGAPRDLMTLVKRSAADGPISGTAEYIVNKASPIAGTGFSLAANKQPTGAPIFKRTDSTSEKTEKEAEFAAERVAPITGTSAVETVKAALTDPHHDYTYRDLLELAADALGSQTTHSNPEGGQGAAPSSSRSKSARSGGSSRKFSIRSRK